MLTNSLNNQATELAVRTARATRLQYEITCLQGKDRWEPADYPLMSAMRRELDALSA
jgi:hypothetical protein